MNSATGSGNRVNLIGSFTSTGSLSVNSSVAGNSSRTVLRDDSSLTGPGGASVLTAGSGNLLLRPTSTISGYSSMPILNGTIINVNSGATIDTSVVIQSGGQLRHTQNNDPVVSSISSVSGTGDWVFNIGDNTNQNLAFVDVTGTVDLTGLTLDFFVGSGATAPSGNVVLASYGSRTGTFANVNGLGPGQFIDYNYGPTGNQIAIVVPEISHASPILAAFLPLFALRRRTRRK